MNKIIKAALIATFPGLNIDILLEVVNATRNPVAATEKLIGVFEEPRLDPMWKHRDDVRTLVEFVWNASNDDQVKYTYRSKSTISRYLTEEGVAKYNAAESDIERKKIMEESKYASYKQSDVYIDRRDLIEWNDYTSSCSVATWIGNHFNPEV